MDGFLGNVSEQSIRKEKALSDAMLNLPKSVV